MSILTLTVNECTIQKSYKATVGPVAYSRPGGRDRCVERERGKWWPRVMWKGRRGERLLRTGTHTRPAAGRGLWGKGARPSNQASFCGYI